MIDGVPREFSGIADFSEIAFAQADARHAGLPERRAQFG
jgi:hypothetical protein